MQELEELEENKSCVEGIHGQAGIIMAVGERGMGENSIESPGRVRKAAGATPAQRRHQNRKAWGSRYGHTTTTRKEGRKERRMDGWWMEGGWMMDGRWIDCGWMVDGMWMDDDVAVVEQLPCVCPRGRNDSSSWAFGSHPTSVGQGQDSSTVLLLLLIPKERDGDERPAPRPRPFPRLPTPGAPAAL